MPYTSRPFNPTTPYDNQVVVELEKANDNFELLKNAFVNGNVEGGVVKNSDTVDGFHASLTPAPNVIVPLNANGVLDLSASYVRSNVYAFRRVDLTNATDNYELQVGEEAIVYFYNETVKPLRIKMVEDGIYELICKGGYGLLSLFPNGVSYSGQFKGARMCIYWNGTDLAFGYGSFVSENKFILFYGVERALIFNNLNAKRIIGEYSDWSTLHVGVYINWWTNTTTLWEVMGTVQFEGPTTTEVLVRRIK